MMALVDCEHCSGTPFSHIILFSCTLLLFIFPWYICLIFAASFLVYCCAMSFAHGSIPHNNNILTPCFCYFNSMKADMTGWVAPARQ